MSRFVITGNAAGAVKAVQDLQKAIAANEKGFEEAAKGADKLDKAAQRVVKNNEGPLEKYNRRIRETAELVNRGKLSMDQAEAAAMRYGKTMDRAGQATQAAFGSRALGDIRSFAAQFVGIQTALTGALQVFRQLQAERERVAQGEVAGISGMGALAQLAATAGDEAAQKKAQRELNAEARRMQGIGAATSLDEAGKFIFEMNSAGLGVKDREFAARLKGAGVMADMGGASTAFSSLQTALGRDQVGSFETFVSKSLAASAVAPAQASEIALAASRGAGSAKALGLSDSNDFLLAATAILAKQQGNAPEGGTRVQAFLKQVEKAGMDFTGKSGLDIVREIASLSEADQGIGGVLGDRAEAVGAFRTLRDNLPQLMELQASIAGGGERNLAEAAIALTDEDPGLRAAKARQAAAGRRDEALAPSAALQNLVEAAYAERQRTARQNAGAFTELNLGVERAQISLVNTIGSDDERRAILQEYVNEGSIQDESLLRDIRDSLRSNVTTRQE